MELQDSDLRYSKVLKPKTKKGLSQMRQLFLLNYYQMDEIE